MKRPSSKIRGFSLIELMVVMMIIGIVMAFAVPATTALLRGSQVAQSSQIVVDQFNLARQYALTRNRPVEVRLIKYTDPEMPLNSDKAPDGSAGNFRAVQIVETIDQLDANGNPSVDGSGNPLVTNLALDKVQTLPQTIIMNPAAAYSTLIAGTGQTVVSATAAADPPMPKVKSAYSYVAFHFRADGSTDLSQSQLWFVTLHNFNDKPAAGTPPVNYFTVQVDPLTGEVKLYRPGLKETSS